MANEKLSRREREIIQHLSNGSTYKQIASTMNISYWTVDKALRNLYFRFNCSKATELVATAIKSNLLPQNQEM